MLLTKVTPKRTLLYDTEEPLKEYSSISETKHLAVEKYYQVFQQCSRGDAPYWPINIVQDITQAQWS